MAVPDASRARPAPALRQEARPAGDRRAFTALVLRTSGELPFGRPVPPATASRRNKLARERHEHWLTQRFFDADARVVAALATPGDRYLRVDMKTEGFGWLTCDYDADRHGGDPRRELQRRRTPPSKIWLSLDRAAERDPKGRPTSRCQPAIDIQHAGHRRGPDQARAGQGLDRRGSSRWGSGSPAAGRRPGRAALSRPRSPSVTSVSEDGEPVPFLRDHIGGRRRGIDNRVYDDSLVVLLDQPLARGAERRLDLEYEMDVKQLRPGPRVGTRARTRTRPSSPTPTRPAWSSPCARSSRSAPWAAARERRGAARRTARPPPASGCRTSP